MPKSKKVWLQGARKEYDSIVNTNPKEAKQKKLDILKRSLEHIPNDLDLWKETINLEDEEGAKKLLYRAVECVPHSTEMWLALSKLENYENAKQVLNNAIQTIPTDHTFWVSAAVLEET